MRFGSFLVASILLVACGDGGSTPVVGSTGEVAGSSSSAGTTGANPGSTGEAESSSSTGEADGSSSSGGETVLEAITLERAWVERAEGPWLGPVRDTPLGDLPEFFLDFGWTEDDALGAVADNGMGFRLEFVFSEIEGQWVLTESGTLPGGQTQSYVMHPVGRDGDQVRFEVLDRPGYLQVEILPSEATFEMVVSLRGHEHGTFDLARPG